MNMRFKLAGLAAALVLSLTSATVVMAARPMRLHIEVPTTIGSSPNTFTASGPAVDAGIVCPVGKVHELSNVLVDTRRRGRIQILKVVKRFDCGDNSGTFDVSLLVRLNLVTHRTTAKWSVIGGTGAYAALRGNGRLVGIPIVPGVSIQDIYKGRVR